MNLHDDYVIDELVRLTEQRMQELPIKRRAAWLKEWAATLYENFHINMLAEMQKRGLQD